jgi:hypothetical protein
MARTHALGDRAVRTRRVAPAYAVDTLTPATGTRVREAEGVRPRSLRDRLSSSRVVKVRAGGSSRLKAADPLWGVM